MISYQLKTSVALVLLAFIVGFCTSFLFNGCNQDTIAPTNIIQPKELKKQVETNDAAYKESISKLQNENAKLLQDLKKNSLLLEKTKQTSKQKEIKIKKDIEKGFSAKELLRKVNGPSDTIKPTPCDSLLQEVSGYIETNEIKDSLYEAHILTQDSIIILKDSVIGLARKQSDELKTAFNMSIDGQQILLNENSQLKKKFKRQKLKQKIISVGLVILSGIGTNYFFNR